MQQFLEAHSSGVDGEVYGITDLVNEFSVTARATRLYEQKGCSRPAAWAPRASSRAAIARGSR